MDNDFIVIATASLFLVAICLKRRKKNRRFWVNNYLRGRSAHGRHNDVSGVLMKLNIRI